MTTLEKKHPLAVRWFHWINVPLLFLMLWSGLLIYWANDVYRIGLGDSTLIHFFPDWFYTSLGVPSRLAQGMALHFFFMWFFAINGALYVAYTGLSGEWRYLVPDRRSFTEALRVVLNDLHVKKFELPPRKFNGAQQIAYTSIILMGAASLVTGVAIYKPVQFAWLTTLLGGYEWARWEHFWLAMGAVGFFVIHIAQVLRAGWNTFRAMVTGYDLAPVAVSGAVATGVTGDAAVRALRGRTRRSFLVLGLGAASAVGAWKWLMSRSAIGDVPYPMRRTLEFNEWLSRHYFSDTRLAPVFPRELAREPKVNGAEGLSPDFEPDAWQLRVVGRRGVRSVALEDIKRLARVEMTTELKCIEGWSTIVHWAGVRLSDFAATYHPVATRYVGLATPDGAYYVGLDMASALHPQTLLCYEINGAPLSLEHGAPLRLVTPVKYGLKSIKRIGTMIFTDERPADFWAERGYDFYLGH